MIHTVGPIYPGDRSLLVSCYERSLAVADSLGASSVAFPLISAGVYGWPLEDAVLAAVTTLRTAKSTVAEARIVAFSPSTLEVVEATLSSTA